MERILKIDIFVFRLVVKNTEDERVHLGSLYIITCKGGSIGSKGPHEVRFYIYHFDLNILETLNFLRIFL